MSLVVMGLSHRSSPIDVLERVALDEVGAQLLVGAVAAGENIAEAVVVATCNRLEVYADVDAFHGAVDDIGSALVEATGMSRAALGDHCYVHYEDRAIAHVFQLACGLDSMAVGEPQILGQLRTSLLSAREAGTVGPALNVLFQQALRVGKRAQSELDLAGTNRSLVAEGLAAAAEYVGPVRDAHVLIVGAGAMSGLAAATVAREQPRAITVVNRTWERSLRLAQGSGGAPRPWSELHDAFAHADIVLTCTGSLGHVIHADQVAQARHEVAQRTGERCVQRQVVVDLALPRDVDPDVALLPNLRVLGLGELGERLAHREQGSDLSAVQALVTSEVAAYLVGRRGQEVAPTVTALRARAAEVMAAELSRLDAKVPHMDEPTRAEVQRTLHRVVEKLLHAPTVRVKQLTGNDGSDYARALRELFDLHPGEAATSGSAPPPGVTR
ncbi:glutamyl-tRNA reductase [Kineosphaera limosa]|uniref:Glutamyl-tRNA reductase n=1 Tax=Kineosphaera limosa NBRC 100340 TaxID=1184609 RepID=K6XCE0_9MICO|nr:glutamyl-tRNA reductase [Kineosphaera limosa]NYE01728.1 glutamyl-tRNA reductase [Kineosphaera limosa]GAB96474.1 glutamyl-tRNA reductase [Kineosphaera limosa NBRC 100340]